MKKTLIAIAALAATSAFAQSSVTMSGRLDAGYGTRVDTAATGVKTNVTAIQYGGINTPFLGLAGTEDLGGGLKAGFYVETALMNATTLFGDRGQYLTLEGGFGKITAGTQNTGARDILIGYDAGGAINVAGSLNSSTANDAGGVGSHTAFSTGIKYTAPTYNGLTLAGSFSKNNTNSSSETVADTRTAQGYSVGGNYVNGPLSLGLSYSNAVTTTVAAAGAATLNGDITGKITAAGASYDLGMAKLYVAHFKLDSKDEVGTTSTTTNIQRKSTTYGVKAPLTPKVTAFASMGTGTLQQGASATAFKGDIKGTQVGVNYDFSKRTALKFAYGTTKAEASTTTDVKVKETALGLVHLF